MYRISTQQITAVYTKKYMISKHYLSCQNCHKLHIKSVAKHLYGCYLLNLYHIEVLLKNSSKINNIQEAPFKKFNQQYVCFKVPRFSDERFPQKNNTIRVTELLTSWTPYSSVR